VLPFDVARFLLKPLGCALLAGSVLVALDGGSLWLRVAAGLGTYGIAAAVLQLLPPAEREFLLAAARHGFNKRSVNAAPAGD
jgi:hypothetical protein